MEIFGWFLKGPLQNHQTENPSQPGLSDGSLFEIRKVHPSELPTVDAIGKTATGKCTVSTFLFCTGNVIVGLVLAPIRREVEVRRGGGGGGGGEARGAERRTGR